MGYLTTFTIYNDGIDLIRKDSDKFCEKLYDAAIKSHNGPITFGHGMFANLVEVQQTRHADDHTIYVHMGNCVTEMNTYSRNTDELMRKHTDFYKRLLWLMESEVKAMKKKLKDYEKTLDTVI